MIFRKSKERVDTSVRKVDKLITGIIIGGAVASIFWLSRTKKWKDITTQVVENSKWVANKWIGILWRVLVKVINLSSRKK